jgi:hypothetical protein
MTPQPWNPLQTNDPKLGQDRLKNKLQGQGIVINKGNPRDLEELAKEYSANPSIWKKMLHSNFILPERRAIQSKGAAASAFASVAQKGISFAFKEIPLPVLNTVLSNAWDVACKKIREKVNQYKISTYGISEEEKVKFELKDIGNEVAKLDGYRWKIKHAIDQYNKVVKEADTMASQPCDRWVATLVKLKYLNKRIDKLRSSIEMIKATCEETEKWLVEVEKEYKKTADNIKPLMESDIDKLKNFAGAHETCTEIFCMYKDKKWLESKAVPTSDASKFLIKGVGIASDFVQTNIYEYF